MGIILIPTITILSLPSPNYNQSCSSSDPDLSPGWSWNPSTWSWPRIDFVHASRNIMKHIIWIHMQIYFFPLTKRKSLLQQCYLKMYYISQLPCRYNAIGQLQRVQGLLGRDWASGIPQSSVCLYVSPTQLDCMSCAYLFVFVLSGYVFIWPALLIRARYEFSKVRSLVVF